MARYHCSNCGGLGHNKQTCKSKDSKSAECTYCGGTFSNVRGGVQRHLNACPQKRAALQGQLSEIHKGVKFSNRLLMVCGFLVIVVGIVELLTDVIGINVIGEQVGLSEEMMSSVLAVVQTLTGAVLVWRFMASFALTRAVKNIEATILEFT